jgi:hypothetical protein
MNETKQAAYEGWAILELMGHQQEIGYVTTEAYGQAVLFRVDQPELPSREYALKRPAYGSGEWLPEGTKVRRDGSPARSRLISPGALYALNPCTEEAAREALENSVVRALIVIERPAMAIMAIEAAEDDPQEGYDV